MSDKGPQFMPSAVQNTEFNEGIYRELIDKSLGSSLFGVGVTGDTNPPGRRPSHLD
jgi:hypothetical protein